MTRQNPNYAEGAEKPIVSLQDGVNIQGWYDDDLDYFNVEGIDAAMAIMAMRAREQFMEEQQPERAKWLS